MLVLNGSLQAVLICDLSLGQATLLVKPCSSWPPVRVIIFAAAVLRTDETKASNGTQLVVDSQDHRLSVIGWMFDY